ncbi:MAG TPA: dTDP-4-dehydrorhamnose 3,5-epimerase [Balneolales bacterium]|nr:dTDP-4-dehydrorhamnose 3,5-epimerase [Balneolales bacterium]
MEFIPTDIPEVILIKPKVFGDERGYFMETYRRKIFKKHNIHVDFVQDNLSKSKKSTIRGLHYQILNPQAKLIMVTQGEVLDVAVDIRRNSPTFGRFVTARLSDKNKSMLYIPEGFAHGFQVLTDETIFQYKCSDYYNPNGERGIAWDDPEIGVQWIDDEYIISGKDQRNPRLKDVSADDLPIY